MKVAAAHADPFVARRDEALVRMLVDAGGAYLRAVQRAALNALMPRATYVKFNVSALLRTDTKKPVRGG